MYDIKPNNNRRAFYCKLNTNFDYEWIRTFGSDPYEPWDAGYNFLFPFYVTELDNQDIRIGCAVYALSSNFSFFYFDLDNSGNRILSN